MTSFTLILLLLALLAVVGAVRAVRAVRSDGYGRRPPPASHLPWSSGHDGRLS